MKWNLIDACRTRVVLADGAMGTELQRAGLEPGECGAAWNLDRPERIEAIHRAYVNAGSQLLLTNTFGANRWVLGRYGLEAQGRRINEAAAVVARRAAGPDVLVFGDIGPCGGLLAPLGPETVEAVEEGLLAQACALVDAGVDGILIETMSAIEEAAAGVRAARRAGATVVVASMAFDRTRKGTLRTMMGVAPEEAARTLVDAGADIVGANCGTSMSPADFVEVVQAVRGVVGVPVIVKANAGKPELMEGRAVYHVTPQEFAEGLQAVVVAGASIVGGCCGTTPNHVAALRHMLERRA